LFGLGAATSLSSRQRTRQGLKALGVPLNASAEHKQHRVRDARFVLAQALIRARRTGFHVPNVPDPTDRQRDELPPRVAILFAELEQLCVGRGISPSRVEDEAENLGALPGVDAEMARMTSNPNRGGA